MLKMIIKNIVTSLIATAALELIYKIDSMGILVGINIAVFIVLMIVSMKEDKENIEKENILLNDKSIEKEQRDLMLKEVKNLYNELEAMSKLNKVKVEVFESEIKKVNESISTISDDIKLNRDSIESEFRSSKNEIVKMLECQVEVSSKGYKDIVYIIEKQIEEVEKLVSLYEKNEELIKENIDRLVDELSENKEELSRINKEIRRAKPDIIDSICENTESNKEVINQYKEIEGAMLKEISNLLDKNKHITELLMANYKVLNVLMEA